MQDVAFARTNGETAMIKWIKDNSYNMFRLFLSQIALAVFGLIMTMWTSSLSNRVFLTVGIFCVIFYLYLIYVIVRRRDARSLEANIDFIAPVHAPQRHVRQRSTSPAA